MALASLIFRCPYFALTTKNVFKNGKGSLFVNNSSQKQLLNSVREVKNKQNNKLREKKKINNDITGGRKHESVEA